LALASGPVRSCAPVNAKRTTASLVGGVSWRNPLVLLGSVPIAQDLSDLGGLAWIGKQQANSVALPSSFPPLYGEKVERVWRHQPSPVTAEASRIFRFLLLLLLLRLHFPRRARS
jgi:hypothetical protein